MVQKINKKPFFIVFEGIDKSGKDTQALKLFDYLTKNNWQVKLTHEPSYSSFYGLLIRLLLKTRIHLPPIFFQYLYFLDRKQHVKQIKKWLRQGLTVISVRYFFSTIAYAMLDNLNPERIFNWHKNMPLPDKVFLINISAEQAVKRLQAEGGRRDFFETEDKLKKIGYGYGWCEQKFKDLFVVIDGTGIPGEVFERIKNNF